VKSSGRQETHSKELRGSWLGSMEHGLLRVERAQSGGSRLRAKNCFLQVERAQRLLAIRAKNGLLNAEGAQKSWLRAMKNFLDVARNSVMAGYK
jgi:hypothetical protein